ncbi:MAG: OmpA family protein, partial [Rhodanobacter sp.]
TDPLLPSLSCTIANLAVGATTSCTATGNTYTITATDVTAGKVINTASATGTPPGTISPPSTTGSASTPTHAGNGSLSLTKQVAQRVVNVGDLVRYTVVVTSTGNAAVRDATLVDTPPAGFSYVQDSLHVLDADNSGTLAGVNPLRVSGINVAVGGRVTITYFLRVGAGVGKGVFTNHAITENASGQAISNEASAEVELAGDPLFDDSLIVGTVFDDRNGDGWQGAAMATGVHVQGGFPPDVYVANSTTVDHGDGPKPAADHSAPMLHGLSLGTISGRSSTADPATRHQVVIRQLLREPRFSDDFMLATAEGTTLHMNAAGQLTTVSRGDAAKGLTAQDITVARRISQAADGYVVDYIITNHGIDERGIPGVRVVSVEGLIMETDAYGRFHLAGVDGGNWARGRNFILKVDPSTLPPGSKFTTENPLVLRITPGVPVRFDFGVKLPPGEIEGGHQETEIALGEVLFAPGQAEVKPDYAKMLDGIADKIRQYDGGVVTITAHAEQEALAFARAHAVQQALAKRLDQDLRSRLKVEVVAAGDAAPMVGLGPSINLGTVLFDTNQATIKSVYRPLISAIAKALNAQGGGVVAIDGRADHRGEPAYNTQLGLRRAKAVYEAIAAELKPEVRQKVRVEISDNPNAASGVEQR